MFFLFLFFSNPAYSQTLYDSKISSFNITLAESFYDRVFMEKTMDFFKKNFNYDIAESTKSIEEIFYLKKNGFYRTEIIFALKFCVDNKITLSDLIKKMEKEKKSVFDIARAMGYNINLNFERSLAIKKEIEKDISDTEYLEQIIKKNFPK